MPTPVTILVVSFVTFVVGTFFAGGSKHGYESNKQYERDFDMKPGFIYYFHIIFVVIKWLGIIGSALSVYLIVASVLGF